MNDMIGKRLKQYEIVAQLGTGGMATVYQAQQLNIKRDVAIKIIKADLSNSPEFVKRFEREAQTVATLSHPHILKLFDYGEEGNLVYLVTEIMVGGSLDKRLRQGPLTLELIMRMTDQIASAMDYAHQHGLVHRDMKPQNVLLDNNQNAYLTDFGIAKLMHEATALTQSGTVMGTPSYMAPEQWRGEAVDSRADIYAFGVMLYEMLGGRLPFTGDTPMSMMYMHLHDKPTPITSLRREISPGVDEVLDKAMAKDRDSRFQSAGSLAAALKEALDAKVIWDSDQQEEQTEIAYQPDKNLPPFKEKRKRDEFSAPRTRVGVLAIIARVIITAIIAGTAVVIVSIVESHNAPTLITNSPQAALAASPAQIALSPTPSPSSTSSPPDSAPTVTVPQAFSSANGTIRFVLDNRFVEARPSDGIARLMFQDKNTSDFSAILSQTWSPDSRQVAAIDANGTTSAQSIFVANADGSNHHTLAIPADSLPFDVDITRRALEWSPDSKQLAVQASNELYIFDAASGQISRTLVKAQMWGYSRIAWSPDGTLIAYTAKNADGRDDLFIVTADGSTLPHDVSSNDNSITSDPAWSSDGKQLVYVYTPYTSTHDLIGVMNADGSNSHQLAATDPNYAVASYPIWSPDGKMVVFIARDYKGNGRLYLVNADGSNLRTVSGDPNFSYAPSWSPDSSQVAYISSTVPSQILIVDANGSVGKQLPLSGITNDMLGPTSLIWVR